jgi:hypothetical protein
LISFGWWVTKVECFSGSGKNRQKKEKRAKMTKKNLQHFFDPVLLDKKSSFVKMADTLKWWSKQAPRRSCCLY